MTLIDKRINWGSGNGSSLIGYTQLVRYGELVNCFGDPNNEGDDDKVPFDWEFIFRDGRYVSIYPYKSTYGSGISCPWHIGGFQDGNAHIIVNRVRRMISESRAGKEHRILE